MDGISFRPARRAGYRVVEPGHKDVHDFEHAAGTPLSLELATEARHLQRGCARGLTIVAPDKGAKDCARLRRALLSDSLAAELRR